MKNKLLIIDPQFDFCNPEGRLYVSNADTDMQRLANFIFNNLNSIDSITVSMDMHTYYNIAFPMFWKNIKNKKPEPFTIISYQDICCKKWMPVNSANTEWAKEYTKNLRDNNKAPLCIWPEHCIIGSKGNTIVKSLWYSLQSWEIKKQKSVTYIFKGIDPLTENYSALKPEYDDPNKSNFDIISFADIIDCDTLYVAGEARTHCVYNTIKTLVDYSGVSIIPMLVFIKDASSDVMIPEAVNKANEYFDMLCSNGMKTITSDLVIE